MRGLVLLFRIRWLLRTIHSKFDVVLLRKLELCGLAEFSIKSMEFDGVFLNAEFVASMVLLSASISAGLTN